MSPFCLISTEHTSDSRVLQISDERCSTYMAYMFYFQDFIIDLPAQTFNINHFLFIAYI